MPADILGSVKNLTKQILNILTVSDGTEDFTDAEVNTRLQLILGNEVFPKFQQAGWACPANYPTTQFSTNTADNTIIDSNIANLVAGSLVMSTARSRNIVIPASDEILMLFDSAVAFFNRVATNNINFAGVARTDTTRNLKAAPKVNNTTSLFGKNYDDGDGTTYDATDQGH